MQRVDVAADDGLQFEHHRRERLDRPGALVRVSGVRAVRVERHLEAHASSHHRLDADGDLAGRVVRVVVRADDRVHVVEEPRVKHRERALSGLLARLEEDLHAAGEAVAVVGEPERGAEQSGHVQVVAAAVHHAVVDGGERQFRVLDDGQAVDVGAQGDARAGTSLTADESDDTGGERVVEHLHTVRLQLVDKVDAGVVLLEAAFRMRVQIMPDGDEVGIGLDVPDDCGGGDAGRVVCMVCVVAFAHTPDCRSHTRVRSRHVRERFRYPLRVSPRASS